MTKKPRNPDLKIFCLQDSDDIDDVWFDGLRDLATHMLAFIFGMFVIVAVMRVAIP